MGTNVISVLEAAEMMRLAFEEGFDDGSAAVDWLTSWEDSTAKIVYDGYMEKAGKVPS